MRLDKFEGFRLSAELFELWSDGQIVMAMSQCWSTHAGYPLTCFSASPHVVYTPGLRPAATA